MAEIPAHEPMNVENSTGQVLQVGALHGDVWVSTGADQPVPPAAPAVAGRRPAFSRPAASSRPAGRDVVTAG
jgi:hypothetical protein